MKEFLVTLCSVLFFVCIAFPQTSDILSTSAVSDTSLDEHTFYPDSNAIRQYLSLGDHKSFLIAGEKHFVYDVQQMHYSNPNKSVFLLLVIMLGILTYVKVVFMKDFEELFQSFINSNIAHQIFRTQSSEISFSSFLLHVNFIVALSIYVHFILFSYHHLIPFKSFSLILMLIFLFTFFYLTKVIALKFIGVVFELNEECNEYIFNFSTVCKMLGLTLIPALFFFYAMQGKFFNVLFIITILISIVFVLIFVWRGLSTGYKLLYRSVYHFFIYVCVVEISSIFLLFKLLTKTIH